MNRGVAFSWVLGGVALALAGAPAVASLTSGTPIPEPTDFALFLLGVAGLVIGRRTARRRSSHKDDTNA